MSRVDRMILGAIVAICGALLFCATVPIGETAAGILLCYGIAVTWLHFAR